MPPEMALVRYADRQADFFDRQVHVYEKRSCSRDPLVEDKAIRQHPCRSLEEPCEMMRSDTGDVRNGAEREFVGQMVPDVLAYEAQARGG